MVAARTAAWAGTDLTLCQLIALHIIGAKAPMTLLSLSGTGLTLVVLILERSRW
jgi:hypothetical protein